MILRSDCLSNASMTARARPPRRARGSVIN
jgi:hypothetical protein